MGEARDWWTPKRVLRKRNAEFPSYDLYPHDLLKQNADGTWRKEKPGVPMTDFAVELHELHPIVAWHEDDGTYRVVQFPEQGWPEVEYDPNVIPEAPKGFYGPFGYRP